MAALETGHHKNRTVVSRKDQSQHQETFMLFLLSCLE